MVARIVTDAGRAYIKAIGNPEGEHALACEWVGTNLAQWFGLPTLDFAIMRVEAADEIWLDRKRTRKARPGPAFVTRAVKGDQWSGNPQHLDLLDNPDDLSRLVVFDTWLRNLDRCPPSKEPRNIFFSAEGASAGHFRLLAMDHTHCFTNGRALTPAIANILNWQDETIFGLFEAFIPKINKRVVESAANKLANVINYDVAALMASIPQEWSVDAPTRAALAEFICSRAAFLSDKMVDLLAPKCWPQGEFNFPEGGEP
ncbi:MAG TPA: HipA family kinase [Phycisphaerae bacterium]|nr:HipA family kinase [Phycisphaerae bacterium]